jgi:hypothetical protein
MGGVLEGVRVLDLGRYVAGRIARDDAKDLIAGRALSGRTGSNCQLFRQVRACWNNHRQSRFAFAKGNWEEFSDRLVPALQFPNPWAQSDKT